MSEKKLKEIEHRVANRVHAPGVTTEGVATVYDEWADRYEQDLEDVGYGCPSQLASSFTKICQDKDAAIVDWGSGTGLTGAKFYHSHGYVNLTAVDISQKSLDIAAQKNIYKKVVKLGNSKELFTDDEFDALICAGCIGLNCVMPEVFREWVRIVKPGGVIGIAMRRSIIELCPGEESNLLEDLKVTFESVVGELKKNKQWEMVSRKEFTGYVGPKSAGLVLIFKVL